MFRKKKRRQAPTAAVLALLGATLAAVAALVPKLLRRVRGGAQPLAGSPTVSSQVRTEGPRDATTEAGATPDASGPPATGGAPAEQASAPEGSRAPAAAPAGPVPTSATAAEGVAHEWRCESCGQPFRISGEGRHRIYWLPDAAPGDPVLDGRCPSCGTPLPGERPRG